MPSSTFHFEFVRIFKKKAIKAIFWLCVLSLLAIWKSSQGVSSQATSILLMWSRSQCMKGLNWSQDPPCAWLPHQAINSTSKGPPKKSLFFLNSITTSRAVLDFKSTAPYTWLSQIFHPTARLGLKTQGPFLRIHQVSMLSSKIQHKLGSFPSLSSSLARILLTKFNFSTVSKKYSLEHPVI